MAKSTKTRCVIKNPLIIETTKQHLKELIGSKSKQDLAGLAFFEDFKIYIDEDLDDKEKYLTVVHELFHLFLPDLKESDVIKLENIMGEVLYQQAKKLFKNKCNKD